VAATRFFEFLRDSPRYSDTPGSIQRLNKRHRFLVAPYVDEIRGSSVLDIAAHDGRWSYALAAAGASEVVGVEARAESIEQFAGYPPGEAKDRVRLVHGDVFDVLPAFVADGRRFDVVALYGFLYHVTDHYGLLKLIQRLGPRLVIVDSEFAVTTEPVVRIVREKTDNRLNAVAQVPGQTRAPVGIPSKKAFEVMAESLGYGVEWADWETIRPPHRRGLSSYYRQPPEWKRRDTCALRPIGGRIGD